MANPAEQSNVKHSYLQSLYDYMAAEYQICMMLAIMTMFCQEYNSIMFREMALVRVTDPDPDTLPLYYRIIDLDGVILSLPANIQIDRLEQYLGQVVAVQKILVIQPLLKQMQTIRTALESRILHDLCDDNPAAVSVCLALLGSPNSARDRPKLETYAKERFKLVHGLVQIQLMNPQNMISRTDDLRNKTIATISLMNQVRLEWQAINGPSGKATSLAESYEWDVSKYVEAKQSFESSCHDMLTLTCDVADHQMRVNKFLLHAINISSFDLAKLLSNTVEEKFEAAERLIEGWNKRQGLLGPGH